MLHEGSSRLKIVSPVEQSAESIHQMQLLRQLQKQLSPQQFQHRIRGGFEQQHFPKIENIENDLKLMEKSDFTVNKELFNKETVLCWRS